MSTIKNIIRSSYHTKFLSAVLFALLIIRLSIDYIGLYISLNVPVLGELSLTRLFILAVIPIMVIFMILHHKSILQTPLVFTFFLIIFINIATIPITPISNVKEALLESIRIFSIIFIYTLSYISINSYALYKKLVYVLIGSSFVSIFFAVIQFIKGVGYTDVAFSELRILGAFTHPNVYGTYLLVIISTVLIAIALANSKKEQIILTIILIIEFLALTMTFTRIAWLMGLFIISAYVLIKKRILAIPLLIIIIFSYTAIPQIHSRVHEAITLSPDSSLVWRFNLWHDTIFYTKSDGNVIFGNGSATFMILADEIRGSLFGDLEPHNEFVRAFVENGIIGLSVFLFYLISFTTLLISRITKIKDKRGKNVFFILSILFLALIIASITDHIFSSTPLQWVLMALIGGAFSVTSKEIQKFSSNIPKTKYQKN